MPLRFRAAARHAPAPRPQNRSARRRRGPAPRAGGVGSGPPCCTARPCGAHAVRAISRSAAPSVTGLRREPALAPHAVAAVRRPVPATPDARRLAACGPPGAARAVRASGAVGGARRDESAPFARRPDRAAAGGSRRGSALHAGGAESTLGCRTWPAVRRAHGSRHRAVGSARRDGMALIRTARNRCGCEEQPHASEPHARRCRKHRCDARAGGHDAHAVCTAGLATEVRWLTPRGLPDAHARPEQVGQRVRQHDTFFPPLCQLARPAVRGARGGHDRGRWPARRTGVLGTFRTSGVAPHPVAAVWRHVPAAPVASRFVARTWPRGAHAVRVTRPPAALSQRSCLRAPCARNRAARRWRHRGRSVRDGLQHSRTGRRILRSRVRLM